MVIVLGVLVIVLTSAFVIAYKKLEGNINEISIGDLGDRPEAVDVEGPKKPLNVLVMGSDNRDGTNIGGDTPGLSDTTILLHLSADRKRAYGVSLPRDAMVERPECSTKNGKKTVPGGQTQFNAAYAVGGPACTIKTVESLTNVRIDHFVVINFAGFKEMVNAINGVTVCVPEEVNDDIGHIHLPEGTYKVNGSQALDYVRVRHDIGAANGDIGTDEAPAGVHRGHGREGRLQGHAWPTRCGSTGSSTPPPSRSPPTPASRTSRSSSPSGRH